MDELTLLGHTGSEHGEQFGFVNTPVYRGSTVLFDSVEELKSRKQKYSYGRNGNPSTDSVAQVITELERGAGSMLFGSGLAAITTALQAILRNGDHLLMTDSAYYPTRALCDTVLTGMGVEIEYYDPRIGAEIAGLIRENTSVIFCESPGSHTFEIQDMPAMVKAGRGTSNGSKIVFMCDNSWASPLNCKPLELGMDMVIHSGTKYFGGHSDVMFGSVTARASVFPILKKYHYLMGQASAPDDCFLIARGLRTLGIRMKAHEASTLKIARWLEGHDEVSCVLHPALESHPDHKIWLRDFSGSSSLFSIELKPRTDEALADFVDNLSLFGLGFSYGGFESLILPFATKGTRTVTADKVPPRLLRIHIGLEAVDDLIADLSAGLARYAAYDS